MTDNLQNNKNIIKAIFIVVIGFLLVPLMTMTIMYFSNENFQYKANAFLTILPGSIGDYFKGLPTKEEKENIKLQVAKHYITLDEDRLADKLLIIRGEDHQLYDELLILLSRENPMKMRNVKERIRNSQLNSSTLNRLLEEIQEENTGRIKDLTDYYSSLKMSDRVFEIERTYNTGELKNEELPIIFENLDIKTSAQILAYLNNDLAERVYYGLDKEAKRNIEKQIQEIKTRENELIRLAYLYENESLEKQVSELGTTNKFKAEDLAIIYKHMNIKTAGQILAMINDSDFITTLYEQIDSYEKINRNTEHLSAQIAEVVKIYKHYDKKVKELAGIYEKMSLQELTKIIEEMTKNNKNYQSYTVGNEEIVFTEEQLALDILNQLKPNKAAELLEQLKTQRSVDLSRKYVVKR